MMDGNSWNVPDFALRQHREARRKRQMARPRLTRAALHLKRVGGEIMPLERSFTGWSAAAEEPWTCSLLLNELNAQGATVFVSDPLTLGIHVGFTLVGFGSFHVRGRIVGCAPLPTTGRIISDQGSPRYRARIEFDYENEAEVIAIGRFAESIQAKLVDAA